MEEKDFINHVKEYANEVVPHIDEINNPATSQGDVTYNKDELKDVYKMNRMLLLDYISKEEYDKLMNLYYNYLKLSNQYNMMSFCQSYGLEKECSFEINDNIIKQLYDQIEEIKLELEKYGLLNESLDYDNLIDSHIKLQFKKASK